MSFSLGGNGTFLPPRPKKADESLGSMRIQPKQADRTSSGRVVQTSEPAFDEPGIKVRSGDQSVRLPIDTPKNVTQIANRVPKNLQEAAQSAVAKSSGVVIPLANFRDLKPKGAVSQPAVPGRDGSLRTPGLVRRRTAKVPVAAAAAGKDTEALCRLVFIVQAAKYGHALEAGGKTYSVEQVVSAAPKAAQTLDAALKAGKTTVEAIEACVRLYCQQNSCSLPSQTGTSNVVDDTTSPQVNAQPPMVLAPPVADDPTKSITPYMTSTPKMLQKDGLVQPEEKSNALWWLLGGVAALLLVKKLAGVKVIGAAMAGAPLVAELDDDGSDDDETDSDEHEAHEAVETEAEEAAEHNEE